MNRVFLFILTNIAVIAVASVVLSLLGVQGYLDESGTGLDLGNLLVFCAVFGMAGSFISLALSKWMAKRATRARVIEQPKGEVESWLLQTVSLQAQARGIRMPEVAIYDSPAPNAFATGARRDASLVAVSTGLLKSMGRDEVEAVLAHEVSHIANGDMITLALVQGVVNTFVMFLARVVGFLVDRLVLKNERGLGIGYFVTMMAAQVVFGILASTIVMWFSRKREFRADAGSAHMVGSGKMIGALQCLQAGVQQPLPAQIAAFGISGGTRSRFGRLFMSHPPLEERIAALQAEV